MCPVVYRNLFLVQTSKRILRDFYRPLCSSLRQYHRKFITSQAPEYIYAAYAAVQHAGNHLQQGVAGLMPTGIVYIFELIQIEKKQGAGMLVAGGQVQHLLQFFLKTAAVEKVGKWIVVG